MRPHLAVLAPFLVLASGGAAAAQTTPPAPASAPVPIRSEAVGGWTVRDELGWCSASTVQGGDLFMRLVYDVAANSAQLFVWNRAWSWVRQDERYKVTLSFSSRRIHRDMHARGVRLLIAGGDQVSGIRMGFAGAAALDDIAAAASVDLLAGQRRLGSLSLRGTRAAVERLKACAAESARRHPPISPRRAVAGAAEVARPPIHRSGTIIDDDYPAAAIRAREQGRVTIELEVGADGTVRSCALLESSGSAALDSATCAIARRRFLFTPAVDSNGRAVAATATRTVVWRIPGPPPPAVPSR